MTQVEELWLCNRKKFYVGGLRLSNKKKIVLVVLSVIILVLAAMFLGFSYLLGTQIVAGSTQLVTNEATQNVHDGLWADYGFSSDTFRESYIIEKIELTSSFDGHTIPADFIYSEDKNNDVMIMVHGLGGNRYTNYPIAEFFLKNGYNVITYDQRSSGENTAERTTFGYWEKYDLIDCIQYAEEFTRGRRVGVWGESFGGATAVQAAAYEDTQTKLDFLILDCPVSSMEWMVEEEMKGMDVGIPLDYMIWCGSLVNRIELGFSYRDADSAEIARGIHIPTLVINSSADKVTPYFMGKNIFDNLESTSKDLWTVTDSEHVGMWLDYNEEYCRKVLSILEML